MAHLVDATTKQRALSRRGFLGGVTASAAAAILAACGGNTATNTPAAKPTTAPTSAAAGGAPTAASAPTTAASAAAPTTAAATTGTTAATAPAVVATTASTTGSAAAPTTAASAAATGQGKPGGSILIGTLGEAKTINPFLANESEGDWRVKMLFDQLVRLKPDTFEPKAGLAKSWKIDGLTFTFTLQDAKFSDGSDLTADDVAFTMKGMLAKATASPHASKISSIQGAKEYTAGSATDVAGIKVVDPKTLVVTLAQPDSSFLINMRFVNPVPKKMLDGKDLTKDAFFQKPIGAGPFVFVSWQVGGDFVAQRNPNYYQKGLPYLDKFTHRTIPDAQSLVNSLLSGDIDASNYPSPAGADKLKANKDLNVLVPPYSSPDGWTFNLKNPWLAKKEVRQAVAYCMDMTQFAKDSLYGLGKPGNGPIAPGNALYDSALKPYTYDLDKAKALIKAAGTPPSDVSFIVNKGNVLREDFLTLTQAQLQKAGWNIKAEAIEYAVATDKLTRKDYDVFGAGVDGATVDAGSLFDTFATTGSQNFSGYSNPQLDTLLTQAKQALTVDAQKPLYKQIQAIIQDDAPTYYAWYRPFLHAVKKKFAGYVDSADEGGIFYELEQWYVNG